jgi:hypothetical protein
MLSVLRSAQTSFGLTQARIQYVSRAVSPEIKRPGLEAHRSPLCITEVKNAWCLTCTPPISLHGVLFNSLSR